MKNKGGSRNTKHAVWNALRTSAVGALLTVFLVSACAPQQPVVSPEQQKRLDLMKSEGPNASLTVLPVRVGGAPFDRATEFIGMQIEQKGLKNIELGKAVFDPGNQTDIAQLAVSLGEFVKKNPISTGYALYADLKGSGGVDELRAIVVDKNGEPVWTERETPRDKTWKKMGGDRDLLVACTVLGECVAPQFGLNEETARAAKPGKLTALMAERSGQPPESETTPLAGRQAEMKQAMPQATLVVFPARIDGHVEDAASAGDLARMINDAGLCKAEPAKQSQLMKASQADPNEMRVLWDLAREFREYVKKNPVDADYVLYADYRFSPQNWEAGMVHLIVCDRTGEWVIADLRNSHHPDYQSIKPTSREDCDKILIKMLTAYLGQTAEQKVLDQFLGTWREEKTEFKAKWTPEEKHTLGTSSFTRILGGRFVQETWEDTEKNNSVLQLLTYDEQRKCYRMWVFDSKYGGPQAPTSAKWNEAARTLEYFDFPANEGQRPTCQVRFVSDDETVCDYMVQDPAGETLYHAEFKMTRLNGPRK